MTPKEKAEDLLLKYSILNEGHNHLVKQCALIAVEEIIQIVDSSKGTANPAWYWEEVKEEIKKHP